ncbi:MAG: DUF4102 domain-containing protein [Alphaproteobacteria bacterium]|nr:DUF4102 domain-containing protein [Alphaproteobacteria bacterium]
MKKVIVFNQHNLDSLPIPEKGRMFYFDSKESKLYLQITCAGTKTFYLLSRIGKNVERIKIGRYPDLKVEKARDLAKLLKAQIAQGLNPVKIKKEHKQELTFQQLYIEFLEKYSKQHRRCWKNDKCVVEKHCQCLFHKKVSEITPSVVNELIQKLSTQSYNTANAVLERIRVIFNRGIEWGLYKGENPAKGIKSFPKVKRDRFLRPDEIKDFLTLLGQEKQELQDLIHLLLFTSARKGNVLSMEWSEIDFNLKLWTIPASKSKNKSDMVIPLMDKAIQILKRRKESNNTIYVFPSEKGSQSGHLTDFKKSWSSFREKWFRFREEKYHLPQKLSKSDIKVHDLRRTGASYQALCGSSLLIIGKSLGHQSTKATEIYAKLQVEPVKQSMEKAMNLISEQMKG